MAATLRPWLLRNLSRKCSCAALLWWLNRLGFLKLLASSELRRVSDFYRLSRDFLWPFNSPSRRLFTQTVHHPRPRLYKGFIHLGSSRSVFLNEHWLIDTVILLFFWYCSSKMLIDLTRVLQCVSGQTGIWPAWPDCKAGILNSNGLRGQTG